MDVTRLTFQHLKPETTAQFAPLLGVTEGRAAELAGAAVPAALVMMLAQLEAGTGPARLREALAAGRAPTFARLGDALTNAPDEAARTAEAEAEAALGADAFAELAGELGATQALPPDAARRLAGRASAFVLAALNESAAAHDLSAPGVLEMLRKQKGSVALAIPAGLAREMDPDLLRAGLDTRVEEAQTSARPAAGAHNRPGAPQEPADPGPHWWRWVIPGSAALVILAGLAWMMAG